MVYAVTSKEDVTINSSSNAGIITVQQIKIMIAYL